MLFGTVKVGEIPRVIAAIDGENTKEKLFKARELKVDLIEARIDLLKEINEETIENFLDIIADFGFYCVATIRPIWEGGKCTLPEEKRFNLFSKLINHPSVAAIDIELRATEIIKRVVTLTSGSGKKTIISYHDFQKTPEKKSLTEIFSKAKSLSADIVKCAFKANSYRDIAAVSSTIMEIEIPKIFMLMGEKGSISRLDSFIFGSLLSYTFLDKAVAPGQIEAKELINLLIRFYPEYRKRKFLTLKGEL